MDIKNVIIFLVIFLVILWLQHNDDIKNNIKRNNLYDKIKIPLVSALFVIIIKEFNYDKCIVYFQSFFISENPENPINIIKQLNSSNLFSQNTSNNINMLPGNAPF
jgi:hypothetical protein